MRLICFFVAVIAPRIAIINGNSGADFWNSDATQTPFLLECSVPANSSVDSINVNLTAEERKIVEIEGRCFLACATQDQYMNQVKQLTMIVVFSVCLEV